MSDTLVQESARRLFSDLATPALINAAEAGTFPAELWDAVEKAGFADALAAAADRPGDLAGIADVAAILHEAGRFAVPLPLAETMLARWLLAGAGIGPPQGPLTFLPIARASDLKARREGSGWRLAGRATAVPWARQARGIAVLADGQVALLPAKAVDLRPGKSLAGEPRDDLSVDAVADAVKPAPAGVDAELLYRLGALTRAVLMAGALEEVLRITVQYANDRVQFGRPIAKFQAIQQQLAVLAENVAASGVIAAAAVEAASGSGDFPFTVAGAKSRVGEAAGRVAEMAHQVHGAIGFTHEHRLHHLTRRLWSWRDEFGVESDWSMELGRIVAARGADSLWPLLTGSVV
ncbi:MAG TPA: acyl-CoA dehydrogenase family protein [Stellaceae bacterium]|nr:acyl-CoA dehydrogenase family protein [Stellaceae bacterium]